MNLNDILSKSLEKMPDFFSSNQFADAAIRQNYPKIAITKGMLGSFLHKHATQSNTSKRMWHKRVNYPHQFNDIDAAISLLKSQGYKIMKPVSDWQEI
jgi:hypothetical protein